MRLNPSGFGWNGVGETSTVRSAIDLVRIETSDKRSVGVSGRCRPEVFEDSAASRQIRKVLVVRLGQQVSSLSERTRQE